jgi:signal transduction histidine kinase
MFTETSAASRLKPSPVVTLMLYVVCTALTVYVRLGLQAECIINLSYGLPLLVCLWYHDRRLLWGLQATFTLISAYKVYALTPGLSPDQRLSTWTMQMVNMLLIGLAVHLVIDLTRRLRMRKAELERSNRELKEREAEISRQNMELKRLAAEFAEQNEEIQQQASKLKDLATELESSNQDSVKRQAVLQTLLESLHTDNPNEPLGHICDLLMSLIGGSTDAVFILEKNGDELVALAHAGARETTERRWSFDRSFAAVAMAHDRTSCVADLSLHPELSAEQTGWEAYRSVMVTPLRLGGKAAGVIAVFSLQPHDWTREQFQMIEWISAQCSMLLDSRRMQMELQRTNAGLDQLVKERTAELQELVNELEHFSYTITHDLRAPLRAMHGFAGLLADECMTVLNTQSREYLSRITTAAGRMDRLITDALSYSKVVRNEMPKESIDVGRLLRGMVESYPIFQKPHAQIEIADDLPPVLGNEAGLTQCFSNLLGNAVKFVAPGRLPIVRITGQRHGCKVRLWCEDNGIGIPKELQSRVFVMFQRLSKNYEGTGIGLTLVKKVVERMEGSVGIESEEGQGCRFWIELNAADTTT